MVKDKSSSQKTVQSFSDKWRNHPELAFKETLNPNSRIHQWILKRNGFVDDNDAAKQLARYSRILDAGCGNGRIAALLSTLAPRAEVVGVDLNALDIAEKNTAGFKKIKYQWADLSANLNFLGSFDFIYCQEVLHHLEDPIGAFANLVDLLEKGGKITIYVYNKKPPAREFMDNYISDKISALDYKQAMESCSKITKLGEILSALAVEIEVEDIPLLGIKKGKYQIQRFLYHHFLKCYWNEELGHQDNTAVNYDWYHPKIRSSFTLDEIRKWFREKSLTITWSCEDHYGITMHGEKPK